MTGRSTSTRSCSPVPRGAQSWSLASWSGASSAVSGRRSRRARALSVSAAARTSAGTLVTAAVPRAGVVSRVGAGLDRRRHRVLGRQVVVERGAPRPCRPVLPSAPRRPAAVGRVRNQYRIVSPVSASATTTRAATTNQTRRLSSAASSLADPFEPAVVDVAACAALVVLGAVVLS